MLGGARSNRLPLNLENKTEQERHKAEDYRKALSMANQETF
jgi:hypothetical protein